MSHQGHRHQRLAHSREINYRLVLFLPNGRIAGVDGRFVLGVTASPPMCCSEASANMRFPFFLTPRKAGVSSISSRF